MSVPETPAPAERNPSGALSALITDSDPKSPAAEAYRILRTNIQFAGLDQPYRTLVVTSASAGEGKTTTVANFGVVIAQSGLRVCLIDADLRRPALHRLFGLRNDQGLTTALVEGWPLAKVAQATHVTNLSVLTSGPPPPNPAELVGSRRMRELLDAATADYDLIICDSPPVISVTDGVALAAQVDGVLMVVMVSKMPQAVVKRATEQILAVKARIIGVVMNNVDLRRDGYYYDYYRYYHAYYGADGKR
jgi:capsular exopolysaccharide synthesis family protein